MTAERESELLDAASGAPSATGVLDLCDRALDEVGRRRHLFSWLRAPGSTSGEWLPVDAYYPSRRLVVICRPADDEHDRLFAELIPAHGLRLLRLVPDDFGSDAERQVRERIERVELPPRRVLSAQTPGGAGEAVAPRESAFARMSASLAQATAPPARERPQRGRRRPPPRTPETDASLALGVALGVALALVLGAELFIGVEDVGFGGAHWLLAFGFALDACARVLGTVAAGRASRGDWAWSAVILGSPAVAAFTLFARDGRMTTEPGPIAGLIAVIALAAIVLALIGSLLGV